MLNSLAFEYRLQLLVSDVNLYKKYVRSLLSNFGKLRIHSFAGSAVRLKIFYADQLILADDLLQLSSVTYRNHILRSWDTPPTI